MQPNYSQQRGFLYSVKIHVMETQSARRKYTLETFTGFAELESSRSLLYDKYCIEIDVEVNNK